MSKIELLLQKGANGSNITSSQKQVIFPRISVTLMLHYTNTLNVAFTTFFSIIIFS